MYRLNILYRLLVTEHCSNSLCLWNQLILLAVNRDLLWIFRKCLHNFISYSNSSVNIYVVNSEQWDFKELISKSIVPLSVIHQFCRNIILWTAAWGFLAHFQVFNWFITTVLGWWAVLMIQSPHWMTSWGERGGRGGVLQCKFQFSRKQH